MKLIQKLERKLSWRRKNYNFPTASNSKAACNATNGSLIAEDINSTTVNVSGTEFSRYIRFDSMVDPQPLPGITYQMVKIKPNHPQTPPQIQRLPQNHRNNGDHQSSLLECKENLDDHSNIYDDLISQKPSRNNQQQAKDVRVRNRIRTNPWFNSRFGLNNILKSSIGEENLYESIDHLNETTIAPSSASSASSPISPLTASSPSSPCTSSSMSTFDRPIKSFKSDKAQKTLANTAILLDKTNYRQMNDQPTAGGGRSTFLRKVKANDTASAAAYTVEATKISRKSYLNRLSCCRDKDQPQTKNKPINEEYQYLGMSTMDHGRDGNLKRKLPMDNEEWSLAGCCSSRQSQQSLSVKKIKRKEMKLPKKINKLITELKMVHEAIEEIKNFDDDIQNS